MLIIHCNLTWTSGGFVWGRKPDSGFKIPEEVQGVKYGQGNWREPKHTGKHLSCQALGFVKG